MENCFPYVGFRIMILRLNLGIEDQILSQLPIIKSEMLNFLFKGLHNLVKKNQVFNLFLYCSCKFLEKTGNYSTFQQKVPRNSNVFRNATKKNNEFYSQIDGFVQSEFSAFEERIASLGCSIIYNSPRYSHLNISGAI